MAEQSLLNESNKNICKRKLVIIDVDIGQQSDAVAVEQMFYIMTLVRNFYLALKPSWVSEKSLKKKFIGCLDVPDQPLCQTNPKTSTFEVEHPAPAPCLSHYVLLLTAYHHIPGPLDSELVRNDI